VPLSYPHLDTRTRAFMLRELRRDRRRKRLVPSPRLSPEGKKRFPKPLEAAIERGGDASLAASLRGFLNPLEVKRSPFCVADVPKNARRDRRGSLEPLPHGEGSSCSSPARLRVRRSEGAWFAVTGV